jgi:hypothetical protein
MALDNIHYPHAIRLPNPEIVHLTAVNPDRGYNVVTESAAGEAVPCFVGVGSIAPVLTFTSRQLKSILDVLTVQSLLRDLSGDTVDLWYRAGRPMDIREENGVAKHIVARLATSAMLYWNQIRVTQGSIAEIDCSMPTAKRTIADPMVWLGSQTLPTVSGCQRIYGMGPVRLNGTLLTGVTGWTMTSNVQLEQISADGDKFLTYLGVNNFHPQVQLNSANLNEIVASSNGGDAFNTLDLYLQRMVSTDVFDSPTATTHIRVTLFGGLRTVPGATGSPATVSPMFYSVKSSSFPTHSFNTAINIS